jgi:small conductance mechanosensitive channel
MIPKSLLDTLRYDLWGPLVLDFGGRLLTALVIVAIGWWLAQRVGRIVERAITARAGDLVLATFLRRVVTIALIVVTVIGALDRLGVPVASLLAALGAAGLALALAMRESLSNLAAGVLLVITRPFRAGDFVDLAGQQGEVQRIDLLQTVLTAVDNRLITLPNSQVMNQPIINFSARAERRLDLPVSIAYEDDPTRALAVIRRVLDEHPRVLKTREPQLLVQRFGASSVELAVRPWVRNGETLVAQSELLAAIKIALDEAGITIPLPQQVMRLSADALAALPASSSGESGAAG